jgi:hypothetical protein
MRTPNPNHHLWNNRGIYFIHYTVRTKANQPRRVRRTLGTKNLKVARQQRDLILARLMIASN